MNENLGTEEIFLKGEKESCELALEITDICRSSNIMKENMSVLDGYSFMKAFIKLACAMGKMITLDAPQEIKDTIPNILQEEINRNYSE